MSNVFLPQLLDVLDRHLLQILSVLPQLHNVRRGHGLLLPCLPQRQDDAQGRSQEEEDGKRNPASSLKRHAVEIFARRKSLLFYCVVCICPLDRSPVLIVADQEGVEGRVIESKPIQGEREEEKVDTAHEYPPEIGDPILPHAHLMRLQLCDRAREHRLAVVVKIFHHVLCPHVAGPPEDIDYFIDLVRKTSSLSLGFAGDVDGVDLHSMRGLHAELKLLSDLGYHICAIVLILHGVNLRQHEKHL
mmetsp:Transcript_44223/g.139520  ORF Transcript_44223/g.139520 Transcript_44223/m.139520 type:complete len:246 (-) Transcript_44223:565-1302(-)